MRHSLRAVLTSLAVLAAFSACVVDDGAKPEDGEEGKEDRWDYRNSPDRFQIQLNYRLADLPQSGEVARIPWPDDYWSYIRDSINYRWRGSSNLSPAELYDVAFNGWTVPEGYMSLRPRTGRNEWDRAYYDQLGPLARDVHRNRGNYQCTNGSDDDSDGQTDEYDGDGCDGIEGWWGVCHAWAPAAVLEEEPLTQVTYGGQTFTASDIKALMMIAYDSTSAIMLGGRCNARELERDSAGRVTNTDCRDTNAGAFHVVITNMLGIQRRSFVEDKTANYEVWNQPLRSFQVTSLRNGLSAADANRVLGATGDTYRYNADAVSFAEVNLRLSYISESQPSVGPRLPQIDTYTYSDDYHYILELDRDGNIIGGEWAPDSQTDHPDFLWLPTRHGSSIRTLTYENVSMLLTMSRNGGGGGGGGGTGEGQVFEVTPNTSIPDNAAAGVVVPLNVTATGTISSLRVAVDIEHTYIGDLTVALRRNGQEVVLQRHAGGSTDNLVEQFPVDQFNGQDISGTWELFVSDDAGQDTGRVRKFGLVAVLGGGGGGGGGGSNTRTYSSTGGPWSIPDNRSSGVTSTITVPDNGVVGDLRVRVNITHTYIGDLIVELRHNGQVRRLHNRTGGSTDNIQTEYQVQELNGSPLQGAWDLVVSDRAGADTGRIVDWSMTATVR